MDLHSRSGPGTALVTWEADRILRYRLTARRTATTPSRGMWTGRSSQLHLDRGSAAGGWPEQARSTSRSNATWRGSRRPGPASGRARRSTWR
ncbi:MAG: hypothetical protein WKF75_04305 [Singulisphaera sp.]